MRNEDRIIIAGGGPVGLIVGLILGRAGIKVSLFEKGDIRYQHPRAATIHPATLDQLARVMKDGAELRVASDHADYIEWSLTHLSDHPAFFSIRTVQDWHQRPAEWPETRYVAKARAQGRAPVFLIFRRRPR